MKPRPRHYARRPFYLATALLLTALLLAACDEDTFFGIGPLETRTFDLPAFTELDVSNAFTVRATAGTEPFVSIQTNADVFDRLLVEVRGDTLFLGLEPDTRLQDTRLEATITAPDLTRIDVSGASDLLLAGQATLLLLDASGASDLAAEALTIDRARVDLSGASSASLTVTTLIERAQLSGASSLLYGGGATIDER